MSILGTARRIMLAMPVRHAVTFVAAIALLLSFATVYAKWADMHRWNRAFADASVVLLAITMTIGPLSKIIAPLRPLQLYRREFGLYSVLMSTVHIIIVIDGWLRWDWLRIVGLVWNARAGHYVLAEHGFGLANSLGVIAMAYGFFLALTSSNLAIQLLTGPIWKFVQRGAYVLWVLVVAHTAYFLFMHFVHFHQRMPDPSPLRWPFVGLVAAVLLLRIWATTHLRFAGATRRLEGKA